MPADLAPGDWPTMAETAREHQASDMAAYGGWLCNCESCQHVRATSSAAAALGRLGGSVKGPSKRRDVDYSALGRKGNEAKKAKRGG